MSSTSEQSVLQECDRKYLRFFCMTCGSRFAGNDRNCKRCGGVFAGSTESVLADEFEAASDEVKIKILEGIDSGRIGLACKIALTVAPSVLPGYDERFLGFFCMSCGDMFSGESMNKKKCVSCGAVVAPATQESLCNEFSVADAPTQQKVIRGIILNRDWLGFASFFSKKNRMNM